MLRKSVGGTVVVLATVLATGVAGATPPHGIATFDNIARGPAVGAATVNVTPGTGAYLGSYSLAPGASSGWQRRPGLSMLAVTAGTVRVAQALGCTTHDYTAPEVAVLPAGTVEVSNVGNTQTRFIGYFDGLSKQIRKPLAEGAAVPAPSGCPVAPDRVGPTGVSVADIAQGLWSQIADPAGHSHLVAARSKVPDGADIMMLRIDHVMPGTGTGWYRHAPGIAFLLKGKAQTYEPTDAGCAKVEEAVAGQVISHVQHDLHYTLVPADSEPATFIVLYWGMGSDRTDKPGLLNFAEANDFTPMPPPNCTMF